jgi:hypothetical protein
MKHNGKIILVLLLVVVLSVQVYSDTASTSVLVWWQNFTLNTTTQIIVNGVSTEEINFSTDDLVNITVLVNNTDTEALNTTFFSGALLVEIRDDSGIVGYFSVDDNIYVNADSVEYFNYTNDFSSLSDGSYTLMTRIVYSYPSKNFTLLDGGNLPINTTNNITIYTPVVPPSGEPPGGGGGVQVVTKYPITYSTGINPEKLSSGDTAKLYINVTNKRSETVKTNVKIYVLKDYEIILEKEKNITTSPNGLLEDTTDLFTMECSSKQGEYQVKVEFYEFGTKKKTENLKFNVLPCKSIYSNIQTGKLIYYINETSEVKYNLENRGNTEHTGTIEIFISDEIETKIAKIDSVRISIDQKHEGSITLPLIGYEAGLYKLILRYSDTEILSESDTNLLISEEAATVMNIMIWLIIITALILTILAIIEIYKSGKELVKVYKHQNQT